VEILKNEYILDREIFDRKVRLICKGKVFCVALSEVRIEDEAILELVYNGKVGRRKEGRHPQEEEV